MPADKITIIPLGFAFDEVNEVSKLRSSFRDSYHLQPSDIAVGIVGRIVAVKNHAYFLEVIQAILHSEEASKTAFFIIGDGDLKLTLQYELSKKQIFYNDHSITNSNRVIFTSWITDLYEVMNGLDIVALTSLNEGTPLSIIEAQFFKKPVVCTDVGGVRDTMADGVTGYLAVNNKVEDFVLKLKTLINDESLRTKMGEEGFNFVEYKFAKKNEIATTKSFYFSLLNSIKW